MALEVSFSCFLNYGGDEELAWWPCLGHPRPFGGWGLCLWPSAAAPRVCMERAKK